MEVALDDSMNEDGFVGQVCREFSNFQEEDARALFGYFLEALREIIPYAPPQVAQGKQEDHSFRSVTGSSLQGEEHVDVDSLDRSKDTGTTSNR